MRRPAGRAVLALVVAVGAGCQDYNFNPVGKCLIQPSSERVTLSSVSSADVLFVVDDSGSMAGEQSKLAANFSAFIANIDTYNNGRRDAGLEPFDFHIAVTTTSVSFNPTALATCRSDCGSSAGSLVCCGDTSSAPIKAPKQCTADPDCSGGQTCRSDCIGLLGDRYCCNATRNASLTEVVPCTREGLSCGQFQTHYQFSSGCNVGVGADQWPFPQGAFVGWQGNPRVLHFDKQLYELPGSAGCPTAPCKNRQGLTSAQLQAFFSDPAQGNVIVGTCGSGQEQAMNGARMAVEAALSGSQKDTLTIAGAPAWDAPTRTASAPAEWPHPGAKLVVVFVGDEDDCSGPPGPNESVVWLPEPAGADACVRDATLPASQQRETPVSQFLDYLTGLGRPLGAAFIVGTAQTICGRENAGVTDVCTPGTCCDYVCTGSTSVCTTATCGAQAPGFRYLELSQGLKARGADVVAGSICDPDFSQLLDQIANVVRPPSGLILPTQPAEGVITSLRIADSSGQTVVRGGVKVICKGPAPAGLTTDEAKAAGWDWWFTATRDPGPPVALSKFVYINHDTGKCEANPGETYAADYIGMLPPNGCVTRDDCQQVLGGQRDSWGCYVPSGQPRGTCICCSAGSTEPACQAP